MMICMLLDFIVLVISVVIASRIDPVDPILLMYRNGDRSGLRDYADILLYCDTCRSYVK